MKADQIRSEIAGRSLGFKTHIPERHEAAITTPILKQRCDKDLVEQGIF